MNDRLVSSTLALLQPIVDHFSSLENILLKFIDHSGEHVITTRNRKHCSFCKYIRDNHNGNIKCQNSARNVALMAKNSCQPYFTQCHAGLTLVAVPIRVAGQHFGSIGFGEIRDSNNMKLILKNLSSLDLNDKKLMNLYQDIPISTRSHVLNVAITLYTMSNYFIEMGAALTRNVEINQVTNTRCFFANYSINVNFIEYLNGKPTPLSNQHEIIINGKNFIINNYNKPIGLNDVANFLHINPSYFSHLFKQITGCTFKNYLTQLRIEKATDLLLNSSLTINQISRQVGYEDSNYFSRVFKKMTGSPPSFFKITNKNPDLNKIITEPW